jgi:soluble lytic murein transglycosylase-like protein
VTAKIKKVDMQITGFIVLALVLIYIKRKALYKKMRELTGNLDKDVFLWRSLIKQEARANELSPTLVAGLIATESAGDPVAIGTSGEVGLMQLMKAAVQDTGNTYNAEDLKNPAVNIRIGTAFLALQIKRMHGSIFDGLRAYNGGAAGATRKPKLSVGYANKVIKFKKHFEEMGF